MIRAQRRAHVALWTLVGIVLAASLAHALVRRSIHPIQTPPAALATRGAR